MSQLKFSGFTLVSSIEESTSFFVGYDSASGNNIRFLQSSLLLQRFGGVIQASSQVNFGDLAVTEGVVARTPYNISDLANVSAGTTIIVESAYDLGGATLVLPANCELKFNEAGAITNGTLTLNSTYIDASEGNIGILNGITIGGTYRNSAIYPEWFGSTTSSYYWQTAIQSAIDMAFLQGAEVSLSAREYQTQSKFTVKKGVSVRGVSNGDGVVGVGSSKGSIIRCVSANQDAIVMGGAFSKLSNLFVFGDSRFSGTTNGIVFNGVGDGSSGENSLSSCQLNNVVIHSCNVGLHLKAGNNGSVTYSSFINVRTRDCKTHVLIEGLSAKPSYGNVDADGNPFTSDNAFVNSNYWKGYYASGFAEYGVRVVTQIATNQVNQRDVFIPCNNLIWDGVVIEPPYSEYGHIVVEGGGGVVRMHDIRVEASQQVSQFYNTPVIKLGENVKGCYIGLDAAGVEIVDLGHFNTINQKNVKNAAPQPNTDNLYINSAWLGLGLQSDNTTYKMPGGWQIQEQYLGNTGAYSWRALTDTSPVTMQYSTTNRMNGYKTLEFVVPPKYQLRIFQPIDQDDLLFGTVSVNAYVLCANRNDAQWTYQDEKTPIISSGSAYGTAQYSGGFEPIGGMFNVRDKTDVAFYRIAIFCQNQNAEGGDNIEFKATQPQLVKGHMVKNLPSKYMTEDGGTFYGTTGRNMVANILPVTESAKWTDGANSLLLPHEGGYYEIAEGGYTIQKINFNSNRFLAGSEITMFFTTEGVTMLNSSFIILKAPFSSIVGSTISLYTRDGNGIWEEVSRSSSDPIGKSTVEVNDVITGTEAILATDTGNYFNITNDVAVKTIQRLNNASNRFKAGREIFLRFTSLTFSLTIQNNAFLNLTYSDYSPVANDWIKLISDGAIWTEVARKPLDLTYETKGYTILTTGSIMSGNVMTLPTTTTTNIFGIDASSSGATVQRINYSGLRFGAGTTILIEGKDLTNSITILNSGFINLNGNSNFSFSAGDVLALFTVGNGVWKEAWRHIS